MNKAADEKTRLALCMQKDSQTGSSSRETGVSRTRIVSRTRVRTKDWGLGSRRIPQHDLDELKTLMPEVLAYYGLDNLRSNFRCPSPDHEDADPSASYDQRTNIVHCFGCGRSWDVFSFVGMIEGISRFPDQVKAVAEIVGYRLDESPARNRRAMAHASVRRTRKPSFPPPQRAGGEDFLDNCFDAFNELYEPQGTKALEYLYSRGFEDEDLARYGIGFTMDPNVVVPWFGSTAANRNGFVSIPFLEKKCVSANYAVMRPVPGDWSGCKELKPAGVVAPLWQEWKLLEGLEAVYVTEGVFDAMSVEKLFGKHAVALLGTGGVSRLLSILAHASRTDRPGKLVICMDGDNAGEKAAEKIAKGLDAIGIPYAMAPAYPDGAKDFNEILMAKMANDPKGEMNNER